VLNLRHDTCLGRTFDKATGTWKWDLVGDIQKTRVFGHKIPIDEGVATLIQAQQTLVEQKFSRRRTPNTTCSLRSHASARVVPSHYDTTCDALNRLAVEREIRGEDGQLFHFRTHAFRHSKAVELINKGMPSSTSSSGWRTFPRNDDRLRAHPVRHHAQGVGEDDIRDRALQRRSARVPGWQEGPYGRERHLVRPLRVRENRANVKMPWAAPRPTKSSAASSSCPASTASPTSSRLTTSSLEAYEQEVVARIELAETNRPGPVAEFNRQNLETRIRPALAMLREGQTLPRQQVRPRVHA
jgi:hypothetical protein